MFWTIYIGVIVFILGLVMGSFYNVCIYRIPEGLSIITPPSRCGNCKHSLAPGDLIPVISWLMLGRKCRYCKEPISWRYPLVEIITGLLFLFLFIKFQLTRELPFYLIFISILIIIAFIDIDHRIILDRFIVAGLILDIIFILMPFFIALSKGVLSTIEIEEIPHVLFSIVSWKDALLGGVIGGGSLLVIDMVGRIFFKKEGMGFGDVKLMFMAGIFLGTRLTVVSLLVAVWIAAVIGIIVIRIRQKSDDHYMPFGPFLALGCAFSIFFGDSLLNWYFAFL